MKKFFKSTLAVAMVMSMGCTAFAADSPITGVGAESKTIDVMGKYDASQGPDGTSNEVISVDIAWENLTFTFTGKWDPDEHTYGSGNGWKTDEKGQITVKNHSNVAVEAALSFADAFEDKEIIGTFTETSGTSNDNKLELVTAVGTSKDAPPTATAEFTLSGKDAPTTGADAVKVGTITVALSKKAN